MQEVEKRTGAPLAIAALVIGLWLVAAVLVLYFIPGWSDRAAFGEMFGAVNALFSGLALAGVVYAILLQRAELRLQREETEANRLELQRTAKAQERSEKALLKQLEAQHRAAQLTALSSILSHYDSQATGGRGISKHYGQEGAESMIEEMTRLLAEIKTSQSSLVKASEE